METKTYGYTRVSTNSQVENGNSLVMQKDRINAYFTMKGLEQPSFFTDEGISGRKLKNRPQLQLLLDIAKKGDTIAVYSLSRLARNTIETLQIINELTKKQINFVSLTEEINTASPSGKFFLTLLAALAEMESALLSVRIADVKQNKKIKKQSYCKEITGFTREYDFLPDGRRTNGRLVKNQDIDTVKKIFNLASSNSPYQIAKILATQNIKTPKGNTYQFSSIQKILKNPIYQENDN